MNLQTKEGIGNSGWQRVVLLSILGYEASGCLLGGILLILSPEGSLMKMPVDIMHGIFSNFLIPGIILFGLGLLNAWAFISVLRKTATDWLTTGLALGGLFIWFVVEIFILNELHWLHAMWGLPVLLGWIVSIPLIAFRNETTTFHKGLLMCGVVSSLWYLAINIFVPLFYEGYSSSSFTVSELSAIGAPTRILWVLLCSLYPLLFASFGWGILFMRPREKSLRTTGNLIIAYSIMNLYWPPMHLREVIGTGRSTVTDTLHIVWAMMTLLFMIAIMVSGALVLGRKFRIYTVITFIVFIIFGILVGTESPGIESNLPTPDIGIWERINIGAFMLWVIVFSTALMNRSSNPIADPELLSGKSTLH